MMTASNRKIIGFFSKDHATPKDDHLYESIDSTLRLWGEDYTRVDNVAEMEKILLDIDSKKERCILILDTLKDPILAIAQANATACEIMLISSETTEFPVEPECLPPNLNHYLSLSQGSLSKNAMICAIKKTTTQDIFGIEKYLRYGTPIFKYGLNHSDNRGWFLDHLQEYIYNLKGIITHSNQEFARVSAEVLDEMMMNAIWDANPNRSRIERNRPVSMHPDESISIEWGCDGQVLALGVCDPFGSLGRSGMSKYIPTIFDKKSVSPLKVKLNSPGAGIGIHMIFRRISGLIVNVNPGVATEFIALFDATKSPRYLSKGTKIFHYFTV